MTRHIDTATLRDWLEEDRPVTVLDIRTDEDRTQWAIPGSVHINTYEALRKGEPDPLQDAVLPSDRPVVTVCNAGRAPIVARSRDRRMSEGEETMGRVRTMLGLAMELGAGSSRHRRRSTVVGVQDSPQSM